jgi:hypothetical protein
VVTAAVAALLAVSDRPDRNKACGQGANRGPVRGLARGLGSCLE